jgi:hypothetical protein
LINPPFKKALTSVGVFLLWKRKDESMGDMDYKERYEQLKKRFDHLMESEFIRGFDAYDLRKKDYVRDIKTADEIGFGKNRNSIVVDVKANGIDELLEKTREVVFNLERAVELKSKL